MNIEIANRLVELRKKHQLSQEELASKLGVSRQAVSKWERAESSPDTDNLICLAKIYNVSLDDLLKNDASIEDIIDSEIPEGPEVKEKKPTSVHLGSGGLHVVDNDAEVVISKHGIFAKDGNQTLTIGSAGWRDRNPAIEKTIKLTKEITTGVVALLAVIAYIFIGALLGVWHPTWIIFFIVPIAESIISAFAYHRLSKIAYPVIVTGIYLTLGFLVNGWHPWWILFITIPIFYMVVRPIETYCLKNKEIVINGETIKLSEVGIDKEDKD